MKRNFGIVICDKYLLELSTVINQLNVKNVKAYSVSSNCLNYKKSDVSLIQQELKTLKAQLDETKVLVPDTCLGCNSNQCVKNCNKCALNDSCIELFIPRSFYHQLIEEGNYIVTPGWLKNWKTIVTDNWKITGNISKEYFADIARYLCVIDTGVYEDYSIYLNDFIEFSGLESRKINIGLDYFQLKIEKIINEWKIQTNSEITKNAQKKVADYTMAFDIITSLSSLTSEHEVLMNIFNLFNLLFLPQEMKYFPVLNGKRADIITSKDIKYDNAQNTLKTKPNFEILDENNGFSFNVSYNGELLGLIEVENILFKEHIKSYISLTNSISSILGILIYNSRQYGKVLQEKIEILTKSEQSLMQKNQELQRLYMDLQASEEEIRASNEELRVTSDELVNINEQLVKARIKAEENDRLKTAFLHNMSHEIRTPLNAILGLSDMLNYNFENKEKLSHFTAIINKRGQDLLEIIDEILDIAKIESNQMTLHINTCDVGILINEVEDFFKEYQKQMDKMHIKFMCINPFKDESYTINTDSVKLRQILINLLNNAFKFTNSGEIEFGIKQYDPNKIEFYVKDTGIGIPQSKHKQIFERFTQAETDTSRLFGGTGLGLSIVQGLIDLLGGKIWLESAKGKGSIFYFSLSGNVDMESKSETIEEYCAVDIKQDIVILIVEDDIYNTEFLKEALSTLSCKILHASNGKDAVKIATENVIDVILMDIRLPDINGYEVTKNIKAHNPDVIIIAQTAYANQTDKIKAQNVGCEGFLTKPMKRDLIISKIRNLVKNRCN